MSYKCPANIQNCTKQFEVLSATAEGLQKPREELMQAFKKNEVALSAITELLAQHVAVLEPCMEIHRTLKNEFVEPMKQYLKDALEKATAKGPDEVRDWKKDARCVDRQEALEDVGATANWASNLVDELKHWVQDLTHKQKTIQNQEDASAAADRLNAAKADPKTKPGVQNDHQDYFLEGQQDILEDLEEQQVPAVAAGFNFGVAIPQSKRKSQSGERGAQNSPQTKRQGKQPQDQATSGELAFLQATIKALKDKVEELEDDNYYYKKKYQKQKELTKDAEHRLQRLNEEKKENSTAGQGQQKLLDTMEVNQQKLLSAMDQGFSRLTIDMLRTFRS
jgi:uncharacterized protein (UPF0305 family)